MHLQAFKNLDSFEKKYSKNIHTFFRTPENLVSDNQGSGNPRLVIAAP